MRMRGVGEIVVVSVVVDVGVTVVVWPRMGMPKSAATDGVVEGVALEAGVDEAELGVLGGSPRWELLNRNRRGIGEGGLTTKE